MAGVAIARSLFWRLTLSRGCVASRVFRRRRRRRRRRMTDEGFTLFYIALF